MGSRRNGMAGPISSRQRPRRCAASLINRARDKGRQKRGGGRHPVELDRVHVADQASDDDLIAIDDALEELARQDGPCAELVKLRFFTGMTLDEAAAALNISRSTANRYWAFARAWLFETLRASTCR